MAMVTVLQDHSQRLRVVDAACCNLLFTNMTIKSN
eukprot:COSAG04_NODE_3782_length_2535_cov_1.547209_1_plen_35_part_00